MTNPIQYINGQWCAGEGEAFASINPSDNRQIWSGQQASAQQVDNAVNAARDRFLSWSEQTLQSRISIVEKFADLLQENAEHLAKVIASETG